MENIYRDNPILMTQGYYTFITEDKEDVRQKKFTNLSNALSYFPGLSLITGLFKILLSIPILKMGKGVNKEIVAGYLGRGILEVLGLGSLFLISDIAITILRLKKDLKPVTDFYGKLANQRVGNQYL